MSKYDVMTKHKVLETLLYGNTALVNEFIKALIRHELPMSLSYCIINGKTFVLNRNIRHKFRILMLEKCRSRCDIT